VMLPLARPLHAAGFHTLFIDARGHGMSDHDGYASMPRFSEDLDSAVDWTIAKEEVTGVGVVGHSIGAAAGILAAARDEEERIACLVSVSGFANVWDMMMESTSLASMPAAAAWAIRRTMEYVLETSLDEIAPVLHIPQIKVPIMIMHGDQDEVVGVHHAFRLAEAAPGAELRIVAGGTHGDLADFEARLGPVLNFLSNTLAPEVQ
ncbi:MAG TPA: alpha/beta fold hydrolase, partial [Actinobacteria bacterium]|nr:alpha/beta fold hydrolase [Actinomycetota bacterium]